MSLASVSAGATVASRSCAAAAAGGANPTTWPPLSVHARARMRIAVVFPAPASAMANCSRAELHIERTRAACPTSKEFPFAADSSRAKSTLAASAARPSVRPAAATSRWSAARIRVEVNSRIRPPCTRWNRRSDATPPAR